MSLPTPLVTVNRFLLSNLSSGLPTHSPSSVHTPITSTRWTVANLQLLSVMAKRTLGLCCTGGCHPSQHHVHDCSLALGLSHSISPGGSSHHASAPPPLPIPPPPDAPQPCHPVDPPSSTFPAHSLLSPLPFRLGPLLPLCRLPLPLLQGLLTFFLLWLQDPLLRTLLHHPLSPRLQFLSWIPASLRNLSLAHLG